MPGKGATQRFKRTYTNLSGMTGPRACTLKGSQHLDNAEPARWAAEGIFPAARGGQGLCRVPFMSILYLPPYVGDLHTNFALHY